MAGVLERFPHYFVKIIDKVVKKKGRRPLNNLWKSRRIENQYV